MVGAKLNWMVGNPRCVTLTGWTSATCKEQLLREAHSASPCRRPWCRYRAGRYRLRPWWALGGLLGEDPTLRDLRVEQVAVRAKMNSISSSREPVKFFLLSSNSCLAGGGGSTRVPPAANVLHLTESVVGLGGLPGGRGGRPGGEHVPTEQILGRGLEGLSVVDHPLCGEQGLLVAFAQGPETRLQEHVLSSARRLALSAGFAGTGGLSPLLGVPEGRRRSVCSTASSAGSAIGLSSPWPTPYPPGGEGLGGSGIQSTCWAISGTDGVQEVVAGVDRITGVDDQRLATWSMCDARGRGLVGS